MNTILERAYRISQSAVPSLGVKRTGRGKSKVFIISVSCLPVHHPPIEILPVQTLPLVKQGDDIAALIRTSLDREGIALTEGDVLVVASTIISKAEGCYHDLSAIIPGENARELAEKTGKDPRLCELIIRYSPSILRVGDGPIIAMTPHGFICASAGIDTSNIAGSTDIVCTLPEDPDASARAIRTALESSFGTRLAVIVSDTHGRPFRSGAIGVCVGLSGIEPFWHYKGEHDLYGYELHASLIARADEIASAADLAMGQSDDGVPVVIVRNARYHAGECSAKAFNREAQSDLFR